jgi:hypothetical protein
MYLLGSAGVEENTFGSSGFTGIDMCLRPSDRRSRKGIGIDHTAIPIFRSLPSRAASTGSSFSMIVSTERSMSGFAAALSLPVVNYSFYSHAGSQQSSHTSAAALDAHR